MQNPFQCEKCKQEQRDFPMVKCHICGRGICKQCSFLGGFVETEFSILGNHALNPCFCKEHMQELSGEEKAEIEQLTTEKTKMSKIQLFHFPYVLLVYLFIIPGLIFVNRKGKKNRVITKEMEKILQKYRK